jgi:predicted XRE-type DNA-binding protein
MYTEVKNVWESQAKSPEEALALQARADLMINLREIIHQNDWSQKEAAQHLGVTQNRISYINTGRVSKFTTDKLIGLLSKAGYKVSLSVKAA